ncbi:MAG: exodeoxyribonuclease VII large subunit [Simkaniaceae bacterium]
MSSILSVSQLTQALKNRIEPFFNRIEVKGEISNFKEQSSGHLYFTLKDEKSQIQSVLFKGTASKLSKKPKSGDQVICQGEISIYAPRGSYQIIVRSIKYAGVGELLLLLHERKAKLEKLGYFAQKRKKPLPLYPKKIGVVTSPTGAVIQDILHVLTRRNDGFHLILAPVRVQGNEAAGEIAAAIHEMNRKNLVDVLIVGRGGGSLEDLWPFNEEIVAEAIYQSKIPIISAIGHETDTTIADFVADKRAPTPSAAAEIVFEEKSAQLNALKEARAQIDRAMKRSFEMNLQRVDDFEERIHSAIQNRLKMTRLNLEGFWRTLHSLNPQKQMLHHRQRLKNYSDRMDQSKTMLLSKKKQAMAHISELLKAANPKNILQKGYCIPFKEKGDSVILSAKSARPGDRLSLLFHDGNLKTTVTE